MSLPQSDDAPMAEGAPPGDPLPIDPAPIPGTPPRLPATAQSAPPVPLPSGPADNGPAGYERPDHLILDDVARALAFDPVVPSVGLTVECADGVVTIAGRVPDRGAALAHVETLLDGVFGLKGAKVELETDREGMAIEPREPDRSAQPSESAEGDGPTAATEGGER